MKTKIVLIFTFYIIIELIFFGFNKIIGQVKNEPKFGSDSITCITNISLYREFYRHWQYNKFTGNVVYDAITPWRWVFLNCPLGTENTYVDGVKIMTYLIKKEENLAKKEKYIDTLMMIYDQRIKYFGRKGPNLGRKAVDYYQYKTAEFEKAYNMFKESVNLTKNKTEGPILIYYFRLTAKMVKEGLADQALIVETYDQVSEIIDYNIVKNQKNLETWLNVKGNIEAEFEPFATCEDLILIYQKKFEINPNNVELLKKITDILDKKGCEEEQLFMDATIQLYKLEPSPESAYLIARMYLKLNNYNKALSYLNEAISIADKEKLADIYYYMAICNYQNKNYSVARSNAKKSLEYNPNNGQPYVLIGDMYAGSAKDCGGNELTDKVAFWAAVDKYEQAKRVDQSVSQITDQRIRDYKKHYPSMETIFFYNLKEGDSYKVECWINETTTVRAASQ